MFTYMFKRKNLTTAVFLLLSLLTLLSLAACTTPTADPTQPTTEPTQPTEQTEPTTDPNNLPPLPPMGTGTRGMGGGGGGGGGDGLAEPEASSDMVADDSMPADLSMIWNPLADATFTLNTTPPTEPTTATVYQHPFTFTMTPEEMQQYAQRLGVNGPIYQEIYPEITPDPEMPDAIPWVPPVGYVIFDGPRQLSFYENNIFFYDQTAGQDVNLQMMPFDQAAPIVESTLQQAGLLNFPYTLTSNWGNDVEVRRIINGVPSISAEFYAAVNQDGQIFSMTHMPFGNIQPMGDYPLRTAEEAWQHILENGFDYQTSYWYTFMDPASQPLPSEPVILPVDELYRYWSRTFNDGDPLTLIAYPMVHQPLDTTLPPRIMVDQYQVVGSDEQLRDLAQYVGQPVRLEGTVRGQLPNATLELSNWQPAPDHEWQYLPGTLRYENGQLLFDADSGETYLVPNQPEDVVEGERVNLSGWSIEPPTTDGGYPVFNWSGMDRIIDWETVTPEMSIPEGEVGEPYLLSEVNINEVDLVYQFSPTFDEQGQVQAFLTQPAWRFRGTTNNAGERIELLVQAVAPAFVTAEPPQP
jgi:hypothetical protein